jgi:hypothetical protein
MIAHRPNLTEHQVSGRINLIQLQSGVQNFQVQMLRNKPRQGTPIDAAAAAAAIGFFWYAAA